MGVEVELEFTGGHDVGDYRRNLLYTFPSEVRDLLMPYIDIHAEGSLTNGTEIVIGPLNRHFMERALIALFKLDLEKAGLIDSKRASTHVHMDVRNFTTERLWNLCALYRITEPVLFEWVGPDRLGNPFCRPWYIDAFDRFTPRKYQALNLLPSGYTMDNADGGLILHKLRTRILGSVEFRHFPELFRTNMPLFLNWLRCLEEMHDASEKIDPVEMTGNAVLLNNNSENLEFLSRYYPKTINVWAKDLGEATIIQRMSDVVTQLKENLMGGLCLESMKPGGTVLDGYIAEATKKKRRPTPSKKLQPLEMADFERDLVEAPPLGVLGNHQARLDEIRPGPLMTAREERAAGQRAWLRMMQEQVDAGVRVRNVTEIIDEIRVEVDPQEALEPQDVPGDPF